MRSYCDCPLLHVAQTKGTRRKELSMTTEPLMFCWIEARLEKIVEMRTSWPTSTFPSSRFVSLFHGHWIKVGVEVGSVACRLPEFP